MNQLISKEYFLKKLQQICVLYLQDYYQTKQHKNQKMSEDTKKSWRSERQFYYTTAASLTALYSWVQVMKFQLQILSQKKQRKQIQKAKTYTVKEALDLINENQFDSKERIFVKGIPQNVNLYSTKKNSGGIIPLLLRVNFRQSLYSNSSFNDVEIKYDNITEQRILNDEKYEIKKQEVFTLQDEENNQSKLKVIYNHECDISTSLKSIGYSETKRSLTLAEYVGNIASLFYGVIVRTFGFFSLFGFLSSQNNFKGVHIGYRDYEFGIKANGLISVLGQIIYDSNKREFRINYPSILTPSKSDFIQQIDKTIQFLVQKRDIQLIVACITSIYVGRRIFNYLRDNKKQREYLFNLIGGNKQQL